MDTKEKRERLLEAAVAVLNGAPDRSLGIVALNKALFFLDLVALRDTGATATGATYVALKMGPVVAKYPQRLVGALERSGLATQEQNGNAKPVRALSGSAPTSHLSEPLRVLAGDMGDAVATRTARWLSDFSHENIGWKIAYQGEGKSPKPINMIVAMQGLSDDVPDPWLDAPLSDREREAMGSRDVAEVWAP